MDLKCRRLAVYVTYDPHNIIDDYIGCFLHELKRCVDSIHVVCNMSRIEEGIENLTEYADQIYYRENMGLDAGAWKDAIMDRIGWEKILAFDELVLVNDSFYGPFSDFTEIFGKMSERDIDFWGLMKRGAGKYGKTGSDPEHILSFFYCFRTRILHSPAFREYWERLPYFNGYTDAVKRFERKLTAYFAEKGFTYDACADTSPNEPLDPGKQFFQCTNLAYEMIEKRDFPFLKRKALTENTLHLQTQENLRQSLEYIDRNTSYDVSVIWRNLIRVCDISDLQRSLALQFVISDNEGAEAETIPARVFVSAAWENAVEYVVPYLERLMPFIRVHVFSRDVSVAQEYRKAGWRCDLTGLSDIEYLCSRDLEENTCLCLIHDMDLSSEAYPSCTQKSAFFCIWENLLKSAGHVSGVARLFRHCPYIGVLMPPVPMFAHHLGERALGWVGRQEQAERECKKLGLRYVIKNSQPPVNITDNLWIRSDVLLSFEKGHTGEEIRELGDSGLTRYLWQYIAQNYGYAAGIAESSFYASMYEVNQRYLLDGFVEYAYRKYGQSGTYRDFFKLLAVDCAAQECRKRFQKWYVYGTGEVAEKCFELIKDTAAFVVSDDQRITERYWRGVPVIRLSDIEGDAEEIGVILCLSKENANFVIPKLLEKKITNYYPAVEKF